MQRAWPRKAGWIKYTGMTVSEARRLKELEQENEATK
jgi:hypothetical protein